MNQNDYISIVMRQTLYTEEVAKQKLDEWDNDYISVIKDSFGIKNKNIDETKEIDSINQDIYKNIRKFMDSTSSTFNNKGKIKNKLNKLNKLDEIKEEDN